MKGSPADPNRIYASQTSGWFGQVIQRSDDGGKTWNTPGSSPDELKSPDGMPKGESNKFVYDTSPETGKPLTTHQWYDGTQHPWEFKRVWHVEPSLRRSGHRLRRRRRRGDLSHHRRRQVVARAARAARPWHGLEVAARRRRHVPAHHPLRSDQSQAHLCRHLRRGCLPHGRRRRDVETHQPRTDVAVPPRTDARNRLLRASPRPAPVAARCRVHAVASGGRRLPQR